MNLQKMWTEMFPDDLEEQLEFLHEEALKLGRALRARRNEMILSPEDFLAISVQTYFNRVREKDDIIGVHTGTRILRHGAGEVYGLDRSARHGDIEKAAEWTDRVVENIEDLLVIIDRKRARWMNLCSTISAASAAILAFVGVVIGVVAIAVKVSP